MMIDRASPSPLQFPYLKMKSAVPSSPFLSALKDTFPVFLGYLALGSAFGILLVGTGYPFWLSPLMSAVIFAGSGQFLAVGLFAAGTSLGEVLLLEFLLNARHIAYGITLKRPINGAGKLRYYLIFALSDETFALLSSLPEGEDMDDAHYARMFYIALLDHSYWVLGSAIGAIAGSLIPFNFDGVGYALTALFIVLMVEQILTLGEKRPFIISGACAIAAVLLLPSRISLLSALAAALFLTKITAKKGVNHAAP